MNIRRTLVTLGTAGLCLVSVTGAYAQRGRAGGGASGGGFRGNSNSTGGRSNADSKADKSENRGSDKKPSGATTENKVADQIGKNPHVADNVKRLLPVGMTLEEASAGFKNRGQFIAALHVSKNLNIPFSDLKAKMTGNDSLSLGKSIHALKPTLSNEDVEAGVKKAEKEAKDTEKEAKDTESAT